ncbi:uncharacterized protein ACN427_003792 [Glossina fuscipes fuscipes]
MPEVLVTVPPLQLQSELSSEAEATSTSAEATARSSNSRDSDCSTSNKRKQQTSLGLHSKSKLRKPYGARSQWKSSLKITSQQKATTAFKLKSHIPRALLLTPSSSTTSFTTSGSVSSRALVPIRKATAADLLTLTPAEKALTSIQKQRTLAISSFRQRKSFSQMDFKHARRNMSETVAMRQSPINGNRNNVMCRKFSCSPAMVAQTKQDSFTHNLYNDDDPYYTVHPDPRMAGLRIYTAIMLNAWRKRRDEVKRLVEEVNDLKRAAIKAKNQLHVFNTLFRVEQKRNDELNSQLKRSLEDINITKSSCEGLTTSLISLKADKALLEQQLQIKDQEYDSLNALQSQTKSDLFKAMATQRDIQSALSLEQRKVQTLENQKNELINEIYELNNETAQKEAGLVGQIQQKEYENSTLKEYIKKLEEQIGILKESGEVFLRTRVTNEETLKKEIESLHLEIESMQKLVKKTFINRLKGYWRTSLQCQKSTLHMLHLVAYYMFPATPPPKLTSFPLPSFNLNKALNIIRR